MHPNVFITFVHNSLTHVPFPNQMNPVNVSHPTSLKLILILSSHLLLGLASCLFPSGSTTKSLYTFLFSPVPAERPTHSTALDLITRIIFGDEYRWRSSSICSFLQFPVTSSLCPNLFPGTPFPNILSLSSSLDVQDQA